MQDRETKKLRIENTDDADTVITDQSVKPIVCIDIWEHAYYIDYYNERAEYLDAFWHCINWAFVKENLLL